MGVACRGHLCQGGIQKGKKPRNKNKNKPGQPHIICVYYIYVCIVITYSRVWIDRVRKVANPARGQLNRENEHSPVFIRTCLRIWSRETGLAVPSRVSLLILHTQAESGRKTPFGKKERKADRPDSSEVPRNPPTRWDMSSIPANEIFLTKKLKQNKNAQRVEND